MTNRPWWSGLLPESFTAVIGGLVGVGLFVQSAFGGQPRPEAWVFAAGCLGVGTVTAAVGAARRRGDPE